MIIGKFLSRRRVISAAVHGLSPTQISANAIDAIKKLQANGFDAYIVGGAVRDLLLGFHPKDFDIATNAPPETIKHIFGRKSRIIGRRFRIVHVYYFRRREKLPKEILEISTFRAEQNDEDAPPNECFGDIDEDAQRRDFTINALFYNPINGEVVDYVGGYKDLQKQQIRSIGESETRLVEDPVRILRAIRMANKLGLTVEPKLIKLFPKHAGLLAEIPDSRLFDELVKVLKSGAGTRILKEWQENKIAAVTVPHLSEDNPFFFSLLAETDRRFSENRPISVTFIIAALFWRHIAKYWYARRIKGEPPLSAMENVLADTRIFSHNRIVPFRIVRTAKSLYLLQAQMADRPTQKSTRHILRNEYFERGLAFISRRQDSDTAQVASWWSKFAAADEREKMRMLNIIAAQHNAKTSKSSKPRRSKKR